MSKGGTYFFTVVTAGREPIFGDPWARHFLGRMMREQCAKMPFETVAIVLLPDHLHAIWTLPAGDKKYSERWQAIKAKFTAAWLEFGGEEVQVSSGYASQRRRGVWQARFIEHTIRDEEDLHAHADNVHYNPVKHRLTRCPKDWLWSSFHRFVERGHYEPEWGCSDSAPPSFEGIDEELLE